MGYSLKVQAFALSFFTFLLHANCQEFVNEDNHGISPDQSNRRQLRCQFGLTNAETICDCKNRNGVIHSCSISHQM